MKITLCMGSSCHMKGSRIVIERIQELVQERSLQDKVELSGVFCMQKCGTKGVSVTVDGEYFSVIPEDVDRFFEEEIQAKL
ncbi:MAG: (2Fe-2S) ferredoxin domain-containing protein [Clostridia bacterium]|nr:(2Fe-2S) ferredoxin domain-containing protein [Clostridia bacterium]